jgi:hypothetical protein
MEKVMFISTPTGGKNILFLASPNETRSVFFTSAYLLASKQETSAKIDYTSFFK